MNVNRKCRVRDAEDTEYGLGLSLREKIAKEPRVKLFDGWKVNLSALDFLAAEELKFSEIFAAFSLEADEMFNGGYTIVTDDYKNAVYGYFKTEEDARRKLDSMKSSGLADRILAVLAKKMYDNKPVPKSIVVSRYGYNYIYKDYKGHFDFISLKRREIPADRYDKIRDEIEGYYSKEEKYTVVKEGYPKLRDSILNETKVEPMTLSNGRFNIKMLKRISDLNKLHVLDLWIYWAQLIDREQIYVLFDKPIKGYMNKLTGNEGVIALTCCASEIIPNLRKIGGGFQNLKESSRNDADGLAADYLNAGKEAEKIGHELRSFQVAPFAGLSPSIKWLALQDGVSHQRPFGDGWYLDKLIESMEKEEKRADVVESNPESASWIMQTERYRPI